MYPKPKRTPMQETNPSVVGIMAGRRAASGRGSSSGRGDNGGRGTGGGRGSGTGTDGSGVRGQSSGSSCGGGEGSGTGARDGGSTKGAREGGNEGARGGARRGRRCRRVDDINSECLLWDDDGRQILAMGEDSDPRKHKTRGYSPGGFGKYPNEHERKVVRIAGNLIDCPMALRNLMAIMRMFWPDGCVGALEIDRNSPGFWNKCINEFLRYYTYDPRFATEAEARASILAHMRDNLRRTLSDDRERADAKIAGASGTTYADHRPLYMKPSVWLEAVGGVRRNMIVGHPQLRVSDVYECDGRPPQPRKGEGSSGRSALARLQDDMFLRVVDETLALARANPEEYMLTPEQIRLLARDVVEGDSSLPADHPIIRETRHAIIQVTVDVLNNIYKTDGPGSTKVKPLIKTSYWNNHRTSKKHLLKTSYWNKDEYDLPNINHC